MKKFLLLTIALYITLFFSGCGSATKYEEATNALNSQDYNTAITILDELATTGYKDSSDLLCKAKYEFVKNNYDRDNSRSVNYLKELKDDNYLDSKKLYDDLFSWKAKIAVTTSENSTTHMSEIKANSLGYPIYYFRFRTYDGPPEDGAEYHGTYEVVFSNGQKTSDSYVGRNNDYYCSVLFYGNNVPTGRTVFNVYGENGELLASEVSIIH